jgi:hypothetical protein
MLIPMGLVVEQLERQGVAEFGVPGAIHMEPAGPAGTVATLRAFDTQAQQVVEFTVSGARVVQRTSDERLNAVEGELLEAIEPAHRRAFERARQVGRVGGGTAGVPWPDEPGRPIR